MVPAVIPFGGAVIAVQLAATPVAGAAKASQLAKTQCPPFRRFSFASIFTLPLSIRKED
jgi:hypothetical protein